MTDKQIIIDANQCEWRTGVEHCGDYECMLNKCCDYNCDWYKRRKLEQQLKAKEQECETLASQLDFEVQKKECLEQECEELKQTLTEIKEIAVENIRIADLEGLNGVYRRGLAKQILQKISECEVEYDR